MVNAIDAKASSYHDIALGRILIGALFLIAAYNKSKGYDGSIAYFSRLGMPAASVMVPVTILFEVVAGLLLIVGYQTWRSPAAVWRSSAAGRRPIRWMRAAPDQAGIRIVDSMKVHASAQAVHASAHTAQCRCISPWSPHSSAQARQNAMQFAS